MTRIKIWHCRKCGAERLYINNYARPCAACRMAARDAGYWRCLRRLRALLNRHMTPDYQQLEEECGMQADEVEAIANRLHRERMRKATR